MGSALLDFQLIQLSTVPVDALAGDDIANLASLVIGEDKPRPSIVRDFVQNLVDDFWELEEIAKTDFLSSLLTLVGGSELLPASSLDLSSLLDNLDLLESWDKELVSAVARQATVRAA